jgi:ABC-type multidrug transport system ATPase subunit
MELQIQNVSRTYFNGVQALKDVTLTIPAGMHGLLRPNGAESFLFKFRLNQQ